jgi:hypothetical protein
MKKTIQNLVEHCAAETYSSLNKTYSCYFTDNSCEHRTNRRSCEIYLQQILPRKIEMRMEVMAS